jgi:hypothetical protein
LERSGKGSGGIQSPECRELSEDASAVITSHYTEVQ